MKKGEGSEAGAEVRKKAIRRMRNPTAEVESMQFDMESACAPSCSLRPRQARVSAASV